MKEFKYPKPLAPGATIGIIAPSSAAKRKQTKLGIEYLKKKGYKIVTGTYLTKGKFYIAGNDEIRLANIEKFLLDPAIDAVFCVRGGYGLLRILDQINYEKLKNIPPKILIGYSDITAIQMALLRKLGWVTYSGPMVASEFGNNFSHFSEKWMWNVLNKHNTNLELINPENDPIEIYREGKAEGNLIGGCFSLITPLLNTEYIPTLKGNVLIIEDVGEPVYRVDKLFQTLKLHNVFEKISGLIVGKLTDCFPENSTKAFTLDDILDNTLGKYNFPVITNFAYGHVKHRFTLPVGGKIKIDTSNTKIMLIKKD